MVHMPVRIHSRTPSSASSSPIMPFESPKRSRLDVGSVSDMFVKLRRMQKRGKAHHIESSSGPPSSHPCIADVADADRKGPVMVALTLVCAGGVDSSLLLKKLRLFLLDQARLHDRDANALVDEQWTMIICGPKHQSHLDTVFRVQIAYSAVAVCTDRPDPHKPVALDQARCIPGLMIILEAIYAS